MRFKGTIVLLIFCAGFGAYLYFYEIKGAEQREKAKQEENRLWKVESGDIQLIDLVFPDQQVTAVRTSDKDWKIVAPRELEADSEELNRMASSAADMSRESVLEPNAPDLARYGLNPAEVSLHFKMKDGKERKIRFGTTNPTGNSNYACLEGKNEVLLVANYVATTFKKKLEDLRNRSILRFDQFETQSLDLVSEKGSIQLFKENDQWFFQGKEKRAADSSGVSGILGSLSSSRVKEFLAESPDQFISLGFEKPLADVRLLVGKDRGIKHLTIGLPKSGLVRKGEKASKEKKAESEPAIYIAKDESRKEFFFVEKELVDKLLKTPDELRDKTFASFKRFDIDVVVLRNSKGSFTFVKDSSTSDWLLGDAKKKTKWDAVSGILDVIEKQVKSFIDKPAALGTYGLDSPSVRVVLKQGATFKVDAAFGKDTKEGVYAQVKGEASVKVLEKEVVEKLNKGESDFVEPPPAPTSSGSADKK